MLYSQVHLNITMVAKNWKKKFFGHSKPTNNLKGTELLKYYRLQEKKLGFQIITDKIKAKKF